MYTNIVTIWLCIILLCGCITHDKITPVIKVPAFYPHKARVNTLLIIADPYNEESKARYIFGKDIRKKNVYPLHLIFKNEGRTIFDLSGIEPLLLDNCGFQLSALGPADVSDALLKNTPLKVIGYGLLGSAFLVMTVPFAVSAGISSARTNTYIKQDIIEKQMGKELLKPLMMQQGFIFFRVAPEEYVFEEERFACNYTVVLRNIKTVGTDKVHEVHIPLGDSL